MRLSFTRALVLILLLSPVVSAQYVGSKVCRTCHASKFESQSKTGHAHALGVAPPGSPGQWAFGAGQKATTWVSQTGEDKVVEHGLSYYAATKSMRLTPGHNSAADTEYRMFDPVGTALRCFRCHSTGPVSLVEGKIEPAEAGICCEACHGPGAAHVRAGGSAGSIQNPKRLNAAQLNQLCGACHRQASDLDDDTDWDNAWNVRHQPAYLHRAACFRNSGGALSCLTCHNPHESLIRNAAYYDGRCRSCHASVTHKTAISSDNCIDCHMPQVTATQGLRFTSHWIGIYEQAGKKLAPTRRAVRALQPSAHDPSMPAGFIIPADPSTLVPLYRQEVAAREKESAAGSPRVARAASDLGLFLVQTGKTQAAEEPLRRAMEIDRANGDASIDSDRENLASVYESEGKRSEAFELYRACAEGRNARVSARCYAGAARMDPEHADAYYRRAIEAEEAASGKEDRRVAILLHELALSLREKEDDKSAEPVLRRALAIQEHLAKPDYHLTTAILNTLGNLLEGAHQLDDAERLERTALRLAEEKFGPESQDLAMTCTNLADVLWNKHNLAEAAQLYRRAISADAALYGTERPETAADIANLGMVMKEAGQVQAAESLLRQALAIYEKTLGADSAQAGFVRQNLVRPH